MRAFLVKTALAVLISHAAVSHGLSAAEPSSTDSQNRVQPTVLKRFGDNSLTWQEDAPPHVLTIRLLNVPKERQGKIKLTANVVRLSGEFQQEEQITVDENGIFRLELPGNIPLSQIWLRGIGRFRSELLLAQGLDLAIDFASTTGKGSDEQFKTEFSGPDAELNRIVNAFNAIENDAISGLRKKAYAAKNKAMTEYNAVVKARQGSDLAPEQPPHPDWPAEYKLVKAWRDARLAKLKEFNPPAYGDYLESIIQAEYYSNLLWHSDCRFVKAESLAEWEQIKTFLPFGITNDSRSFLSALGETYGRPLQTLRSTAATMAPHVAKIEARLASPEYSQFSARFADTIAALKSLRDNPSAESPQSIPGETMVELSKAGLLSGFWLSFEKKINKARELGIADPLKHLSLAATLPRQHRELIELAPDAMAAGDDSWCKGYITMTVREAGKKLSMISKKMTAIQTAPTVSSAGLPPPMKTDFGAEMQVLPGLSGEQVIAWARQKHPGKALIIDIWGPWCGPCMAGIPASKKAQKTLAGHPIAFIYLCARSTEVSWKGAIVEHEIGGTHVFLNTEQDAELMKLFNGSGYPTYGLLDKDGKRMGLEVRSLLDTNPMKIAEAVAKTQPATKE